MHTLIDRRRRNRALPLGDMSSVEVAAWITLALLSTIMVGYLVSLLVRGDG